MKNDAKVVQFNFEWLVQENMKIKKGVITSTLSIIYDQNDTRQTEYSLFKIYNNLTFNGNVWPIRGCAKTHFPNAKK